MPSGSILFAILFALLPLQNYLCRALFCALSTVGTLFVVNNRYVVIHMDGVKFTLLGAQGTADTAVVTFCFDLLALIMGITLYQMLCIVRN